MTARSSKPSTRHAWIITAILALLVLLVPVGATTAYLTSGATAPGTTGGVGRWCSVPDPAENPNVYRLSDFAEYRWSSSASSHLIIVPAVRNGDFGAGGGDGRLGIRAWACKSSALTTSSDIRVTSWRNANGSGSINWKSQGGKIAANRLDPTTGLGQTLTELHREGNRAGKRLRGDARTQYSWLMSSGRSKTNLTISPNCLLGANTCALDIEGHPTFGSGFNGDTPGSRSLNNSVEYLASAYWRRGGEWPTLLEPIAEQPVVLNPYGKDIASTNGNQVQWVVMEWWGSTLPSDDMVLEVFVR